MEAKFPHVAVILVPGESSFKRFGKVRRAMREHGVDEEEIMAFQNEVFISKDTLSTIKGWVTVLEGCQIF